jgi:hypothetical protein
MKPKMSPGELRLNADEPTKKIIDALNVCDWTWSGLVELLARKYTQSDMEELAYYAAERGKGE